MNIKPMHFNKMTDVDLFHKRVLIREDLNVPIKDGMINSDQRLQAALPTLKYALECHASVIVISHLGRPIEGLVDSKLSLKPIADYFSNELNTQVHFVTDYLDGLSIPPGELAICENVRFNLGEKENDDTLAKQLAAL